MSTKKTSEDNIVDTIQGQLQTLADSELSRKEFLKMAGGLTLAVIGAKQLSDGINFVMRNKSGGSRSGGYGSSPYGK